MGGESRTKGAKFMLGPIVGPLGRVAVGGRNWEGFSTDPYLSGALAAETIEAVQGEGVITSTKNCTTMPLLRKEICFQETMADLLIALHWQ